MTNEGKKEKFINDNFPKSHMSKTLIINGTIASKTDADVVNGKAFWADSWETDFSNKTNQDILVCPKTDFIDLSKLSKFKAIIAAEGGLLSHAAIISRELKIPAVIGIGIKNYKKIKTGDKIEMDMNSGKIKILK